MVEIRFKSDKFCGALRYVVLVPCRRKPLPRKGAIGVDRGFRAAHLDFCGPADNQTHCVEECLDEAVGQALAICVILFRRIVRHTENFHRQEYAVDLR